MAKKKCVSLATFKRDGTRVEAPIWFNVIDDRIVVSTPRDAWKVKRVMNNPRVEFAVCTQRGWVTGPFFTGSARVLPDSAMASMPATSKRQLQHRLRQPAYSSLRRSESQSKNPHHASDPHDYAVHCST